MPSLIGNKPSQVPSNGDLGTLAFQDSNAVNITGGTVDVSAGTAALPTLGTTGDPNTGIFFPAADTVAVATNGVEAMRVDSAGNVGVGVTPSAWNTLKAIQLANGVSLASYVGGAQPISYLTSGAIYDGAWKYSVSSSAIGGYNINQGIHQWFTAPSGTAGNAITFTQAMTLNASGNLGIGTTSPASRLHAEVSAGDCKVISRGSSAAWFSTCGNNATSGTNSFDVLQDSSNIGYLYNRANAATVFGTNNAERMRIHASGGVSIGPATDAGAGNLRVSGKIKTGGYTVATLPAGVVGDRAYVTDALAPTYLGALVGGGAVTCPAFYNGTAWVSA